MKFDKRETALIACVILLGGSFVLWIYCNREAYCYIYPDIDTTYSKGYNEESFDQIKPGMTQEGVVQLIDPPLSISHHKNGTQTWWYSQDGKCQFGDFAWIGRAVIFKEMTVESVKKRIYYD